MSIILLIALSTIAAVLLLVGSNIYSFICHPLENPFSRPDILSVPFHI